MNKECKDSLISTDEFSKEVSPDESTSICKWKFWSPWMHRTFRSHEVALWDHPEPPTKLPNMLVTSWSLWNMLTVLVKQTDTNAHEQNRMWLPESGRTAQPRACHTSGRWIWPNGCCSSLAPPSRGTTRAFLTAAPASISEVTVPSACTTAHSPVFLSAWINVSDSEVKQKCQLDSTTQSS